MARERPCSVAHGHGSIPVVKQAYHLGLEIFGLLAALAEVVIDPCPVVLHVVVPVETPPFIILVGQGVAEIRLVLLESPPHAAGLADVYDAGYAFGIDKSRSWGNDDVDTVLGGNIGQIIVSQVPYFTVMALYGAEVLDKPQVSFHVS